VFIYSTMFIMLKITRPPIVNDNEYTQIILLI
jgi:hypothetical protein